VKCVVLTAVIIRLVPSRNPFQGRLEILYRGIWGTVCNDYFDNRDARVACYMLGFGSVYAFAHIVSKSVSKVY